MCGGGGAWEDFLLGEDFFSSSPGHRGSHSLKYDKVACSCGGGAWKERRYAGRGLG